MHEFTNSIFILYYSEVISFAKSYILFYKYKKHH
jgi:hypothetical protein